MKVLYVTFLMAIVTMAQAQQNYREKYKVEISSMASDIAIDGSLSEAGWNNASFVPYLTNHWPLDTGRAQALTEVKIFHTEEYIYIGAKLYDNGKRIIQSLKRDSDSHWDSDNFTVVLDPTGSSANGYIFGVNAGGAQTEGTLYIKNNQTEADFNWNNKWRSSVKEYEGYWIVEMAIPFKSIKYSAENQDWGINLIRGDQENNAYSTWTNFPNNFRGIELGYMGGLHFEKNPPVAKGKVVLIPYALTSGSQDFEEESKANYDVEAGLDAKISLTSSLNLDLTLNPDFSNVEVDRQVTNLTRFNIYFPEQRQFFLENSDLFAGFGSWEVSPFYSRKIGVKEGEAVPILYGARISGNVLDKTRVGIMNVQTGAFEELKPENNTVAAIQQNFLKRSSFKVLAMNKQTNKPEDGEEYNKLIGGELQLTTTDSKLSGKLIGHVTSNQEKLDNNAFLAGNISFNTRNIAGAFNYDYVQENYISELGIAPRLYNYDVEKDTTVRRGYYKLNPWMRVNFYAKPESKLNIHGIRTWHNLYYNMDGSLNEQNLNLGYVFMFKNTSSIWTRINYNETNLPYAVEFIGDEYEPLPAGNYQYTRAEIEYSTDSRKPLSANFNWSFGDFYSGTNNSYKVGMNYRAQPWGNFSLDYTMNDVQFNEVYGSKTLHLVGAKTEIAFNSNLFWTTFFQYNTQAENFNINSRLQWRYKPMSDLFIVYTDNYATENLNVKNRSIVIKLNFWLNL